MTDNLIIAMPSKGRIMDASYVFFQNAGLEIRRPTHAREYVGTIKGVANVDVWFMSPAEIAASLDSGAVHLGVTGKDLLQETAVDMESAIALIKPLGFGRADVVVAVPSSWIDVSTMTDLEDVCMDFRGRHHRPLRVATKYLSLTRQFFARHGLSDYRIVESSSATEGAPASGVAEIVVDIKSTGATLAANNLKVLTDGKILKSEAYLAASVKASWSKRARDALAHILDMVAAKDSASSTFIVRFRNSKQVGEAIKDIARAYNCLILRIPPPDGELQCPEEHLYDVVQRLREEETTGIIVRSAEYVFPETNPLLDRIQHRLRKG